MHEFHKNKKFLLVLFLLVALSILAKFLPDFTNKEEKCEQVAYNAMYLNVIDKNLYLEKKLQKACVEQWDEKENSEWRSCSLNAETYDELQKCTLPSRIRIAIR